MEKVNSSPLMLAPPQNTYPRHIIQTKKPQQRALFHFFATAMVAYASTAWMRSMVLLPHLLLYCNYGLREAHKHFIGLNR